MKFSKILKHQKSLNTIMSISNDKGESKITDIDQALKLGRLTKSINEALEAFNQVKRGIDRKYRKKFRELGPIDSSKKEYEHVCLGEDMKEEISSIEESEIPAEIQFDFPKFTKEQLEDFKFDSVAIACLYEFGMVEDDTSKK